MIALVIWKWSPWIPQVTKRQFYVGPFELVSVEELRGRLTGSPVEAFGSNEDIQRVQIGTNGKALENSAGFDGSLGGLTFSNLVEAERPL